MKKSNTVVFALFLIFLSLHGFASPSNHRPVIDDQHSIYAAAEPSYGYDIIYWFEASVSVDRKTSTFTLTLFANPQEGGTVTGTGNYNANVEVTIEAVANAGWQFVNWTGDVDGLEDANASETTLTMPADDVTLTANFEEDDNVTITYEATTGGSVDPESESLPPATGEAQGSTATPDAGYSFVNWTNEDNEEVSTDLHFTPEKVDGLNVEATYTANFEMTNYTLTINIIGEGTVDIDPDHEFYNFEDVISLEAIAATGWQFVNWTGDIDGLEDVNAAETTLTMPADNVTLTANFEMIDYTLTLIADPEAGGTVEDLTNQAPYNIGDEIQIKAEPNEGWEFTGWTGDYADNLDDATAEQTTLTMPADDVTLTANFEMIGYNLTLNAIPADGGEVIGTGEYNFGEEVNVNAISNEGWVFVNWAGDIEHINNTDVAHAQVTMPAHNVSLNAVFDIALVPEATPDRICSGVSVQLIANDPHISGLSYSWYDDANNFINDGFSIEVSPDQTTTYRVEVKHGSISRDFFVTVFVHDSIPAPTPQEIVKKTVNNKPVVLIYPESGLSYEWHFNNNPIDGETQQHYYPGNEFMPGEYKVYLGPDSLVAPEGYYCSVFSEVLTIDQMLSYTFERNDLFLLFPNPASQLVNILINEETAGTTYNNITAKIFDQKGNEILSENIKNWQTVININQLNPGIYIVEVMVNDNFRQVNRLLITN